MLKYRSAMLIFAAFIAGVAITIVGRPIARVVADKMFLPETRREVSRVTSPDGIVDAVMERIECGAPCSTGYYISIVGRGKSAGRNPVRQVLLADDVSNPALRWSEPHLLNVGYDKAFIHSFTNVVYPFGMPGNQDSWKYAVEIRLAPSSEGFSYLTEEKKGDHSGYPR